MSHAVHTGRHTLYMHLIVNTLAHTLQWVNIRPHPFYRKKEREREALLNPLPQGIPVRCVVHRGGRESAGN